MSNSSDQTTSTEQSELKRLLLAAMRHKHKAMIITDAFGDSPEAVRAIDPNDHFVLLEGGGDYQAAFAELGLPLPIDVSNASGWVVFDGHRIEYQGLRIVSKDHRVDSAWEVAFHVAGPCEYPADRYRPDVVL